MKRLIRVAVLAMTVSLAVGAAMATASPAGATESAAAAAPVRQAGSAGTVSVAFAVKKFVHVRNGLRATGVATATFVPPSGTPTVVRQAFSARVLVGRQHLFSALQTCQVLDLQLDKLSLVLLGLHVDLDKVILTITANSSGGVLGSLFCALAHTKVKLVHAATKLTKMAQQSGLATSGIGFNVPMTQNQQQAAPATFCQVLDLVLGPLQLNLLGLMVHLNQVHLTITADPAGGALGTLFCALAKP